MMYENRIPHFLDKLCSEIGICLPREKRCELAKMDICSENLNDFAREILVAEGLNPATDISILRDVRNRLRDALVAWEEEDVARSVLE